MARFEREYETRVEPTDLCEVCSDVAEWVADFGAGGVSHRCDWCLAAALNGVADGNGDQFDADDFRPMPDLTRTWVVAADVSGEFVRATWEDPGSGPDVEIEGARCVETKEEIGRGAILRLLADAECIEVGAMEDRLVEEFLEEAADYDPRDDDHAFDLSRDS